MYLNAGWSPFVKERNREYQVDSVPRALLRSQPDFAKALAQLPFPLVGVPWYQAGFLPGALTIAHEVGHAVEADCGLTEAISVAIDDAVTDPERRKDWLSWASEIFADTYGCLCAGPAFAYSLADTLAADRATVNSSKDPGYPPRSLRIMLNCAMIEKLAMELLLKNFASSGRRSIRRLTTGQPMSRISIRSRRLSCTYR